MKQQKELIRIFMTALFLALGSALLSCEERPTQIEKSGSVENPVIIPESEYAKLDGSAAFFEDRSVGELYNGSDWTILDIDAVVTVTKTNKTRRIRLDCVKAIDVTRDEWKEGDPIRRYEPLAIKPYSTGSLKGSGADFLKDLGKDDVTWTLVSARGYKN